MKQNELDKLIESLDVSIATSEIIIRSSTNNETLIYDLNRFFSNKESTMNIDICVYSCVKKFKVRLHKKQCIEGADIEIYTDINSYMGSKLFKSKVNNANEAIEVLTNFIKSQQWN